MSKRELAKIAREIKEIKAQLGKVSYNNFMFSTELSTRKPVGELGKSFTIGADPLRGKIKYTIIANNPNSLAMSNEFVLIVEDEYGVFSDPDYPDFSTLEMEASDFEDELNKGKLPKGFK